MTFSAIAFAPSCDMRRHMADVIRDGARVEHELLAPYWIEFDHGGRRWRLTVPAGTRAAPSVPPSLMDDLPVLGGMWEPSIVHDWCYETRCFDAWDPDGWGKQFADDLFDAAMEAAGVGWQDRRAVMTAVWAAGGGMYGRHTLIAGFGPEPV